MDIASRLKELRAKAGLSQQKLAALAGLSISVITKMEGGENRNPRADTIIALAEALGVTPNDLLKGEMKGRGKK